MIDNTIMDESQDFIQLLEDNLRLKKAYLEEITIPGIKEEFRDFGNVFYTMLTYLIQKGFLKEDLYNYEQKSKMELPSSDPIPDGELVSELSFRLSNYYCIIEHINNMYQIDLDKLNLSGIKEIITILNYIKWNNLGGNTAHPVTRGLSMILDKIVTSNEDPLSAEIRFNSATTLNKKQENIKKYLKKISIYHRELYKFKIRSIILSSKEISAETLSSDKKSILLDIKSEIASLLPGYPFFRELIEEIFEEDFGYESDIKKEQALKRLEVKGSQKKKAIKKESERKADKADLIKVIPEIGKSADQLSSALSKLENNKDIISAKKKGLGDILRRFFIRKEVEVYYDIQTTDAVTGQTRKEKVNYTSFSNGIRKKIQLLRNISNSHTQQYLKLTEYSEEMLYEFLQNNLLEIRTYHKRMVGLDGFFKKEEDTTIRARIKGIRVEMDTLKRIYMECTKDLKEYSAIKEEMAQLKALGIQD